MSDSAKAYSQQQYDQQQQPSAPPLEYGTFQGVHNYPPPPSPVIGFPQPVPPPGGHSVHNNYVHGYQAVTGYAVAEGRPVRERRLPCCGSLLVSSWLRSPGMLEHSFYYVLDMIIARNLDISRALLLI
ncbi:hypothetical protein M8C21_008765 [Ambrosia artemisiifolia]|uniref:Uncharacterized protein n=1 Tax=Ambrosia artemisiifolia TaxID=4212 RepID=A0AAD5DB22_AMBAR|nr:hypothetical protein M8C21_008765 [Ambrosia artemisiifolia]